MNQKLNEDSISILLLCTNLAIPYKAEDAPKPLTLSEWAKLSQLLIKQKLRPRVFFDHSWKEWSESLLLKPEQVERIERLLSRGGQLSLELERLSNLGIWITTRAEENYPTRWKTQLGQKCPIVLYGAGDQKLLRPTGNGVAIVGSRDVDETGRQFAEKLSWRCAQDGMFVVSGGAKGVDTYAQNAALHGGGQVVSILSEGLEGTITRKEVRTPLLSGNLLVLSAVAPKARFTGYNAMARNKYVYAFSDYSVVVASSVKGGTWSGAIENLEHQWVPLFVREGQHIPNGNQKLLIQGGIPLPESLLDNRTIDLPSWFRSESPKIGRGKTDTQANHTDRSQGHDVFDIVWPTLQAVLQTPQSEEALAKALNVLESQMSLWLHRAVSSGKAIRMSETNQYVGIDALKVEQNSLFPM